jgi:hypothetical protein
MLNIEKAYFVGAKEAKVTASMSHVTMLHDLRL